MCDTCADLDRQIEHLRRLMGSGFDPLTAGRLQVVLDELEERRRDFRCEDDSKEG
jgi:hypothetical protein